MQKYGILEGYTVRAFAGYSGEVHYDIINEKGDFVVGCTDWKDYIKPEENISFIR